MYLLDFARAQSAGLPCLDWGDPINRALVGRYPLSSRMGGRDLTRRNHGTLTSFTANNPWVAGPYGNGQALLFASASNQYVNLSSIGNLTSTLSCGGWVKWSSQSSTGGGTIIAKRSYNADGTSDFPVSLTIGTDNKASFNLDAGGDFSINLTLQSAALSVNVWHHIFGTFSSAGAVLYVDGQAVASGASSFALSSTSYPWRIGASTLFGAGDGAPFNGALRDICLFGRKLTGSEVGRLYRKLNVGLIFPEDLAFQMLAAQQAAGGGGGSAFPWLHYQQQQAA